MTVKKEAADAVVPYTYSMRFVGMKYGDLISDAAKTLRFTQGVRTRVGLAVGLPIGNIAVGGVGRARGGCTLLHATACCCMLLHAAACCCILLHAAACCCMLLRLPFSWVGGRMAV